MHFSRAIAVALVTRLNAVTPDGVALAATPAGAIRIRIGDGEGYTEVGPIEDAENFVWSALNAIQDEVIEFVTHTGWPPRDKSRPNEPQRGEELPEPDVEVVDGELRLWFGDRHRPALVFPPITADELRRIA